MGDRQPFDELHDEVGAAIGCDTGIQQMADVGVGQLGEDASLAQALAHHLDVVLLQVADAAVDVLRGGGAGLRTEVAAFEQCDVILAPTTPTAAFALGEKTEDPLAMYLNDVFSVPASLAGLPAMSVPAGLNSQGLPLGLQLIGRPFDEQGVLNAGLAIEQRAQFTAKPERWW